MLKLKGTFLQHFAEPGDADDEDKAKKPPKVFSEEYVQALRDEAKNNRLALRATEAKLKDVIGLKAGDDLDDAKIEAYKASREKQIADAIGTANERLVLAELRAQTGYNTKLVEKLIDRAKITVKDDGTVSGVVEALAALETEFPEVKKTVAPPPTTPPTTPPANPPAGGPGSEAEQLRTALADAQKSGKTAEAVAIKNKIFDLDRKKV